MFSQTRVMVLECRLTTINQRWNNIDLYSSFWRAYINKCDGAEIILDSGRSVKLKANELYFIPPWGRFTSQTVKPIDHFYVHFDLTGLPPLLVRDLFTTPAHIQSNYLNLNFDDLILKWGLGRDQNNNSAIVTSRAKSLIFDGLAELISKLPNTSQQLLNQAMESQNRFSNVLRYIESHLGHDLNNNELAKQAHMSLSHFIRTFKLAIGQSPASYVLQLRIARAAQDLIFSQTSIDEITEKYGFANRFHFSRQFKNIMGVSPGIYRQTTLA